MSICRFSPIYCCLVLFLLCGHSAFAQSEGEKQSESVETSAPPNVAAAPKRLRSKELLRERFSLGFGAYYSTGDYGTNKETEIFSIPFRASYSRKDWRLSAQIPYLRISGPASVLAITDGVEVIDKVAEGERKRWGYGDLRLTGQYQVYREARREYGSHVGLSVKVPTASDESELGSGEFDYSLFTGGFLRKGNWLNNGRIGYQMMGDSAERDYDNRWYASLGSSYLYGKRYRMGVNAYFKQASTPTSDAVRNVSALFNMKMQDGWRVGLSLGKGLTDSSADVFAGLQFTKRFVRKRRISAPDD